MRPAILLALMALAPALPGTAAGPPGGGPSPVAPAAAVVPGIPSGAAAVFAAMDKALAARDVEAHLALFDDGFVSIPLGTGKSFVRWVTERRLERQSGGFMDSVLLGGGQVGDVVVASVDHRLPEPGREVTIHKVYFLARRGEGYRILATAEGAEEDRWEPAPEELEVPFAGLTLRPPKGWFLLRNSRGMFLEERTLISPSFDVWFTLGLSDPGERDLQGFGRRETANSRPVFRGMEIQAEENAIVAGLPAWRVRFRSGGGGPGGGDPPVERERLYLLRGGVGFVVSCARVPRAGGGTGATADSLLSGLTASPTAADLLRRLLAAYGHGRVQGRKYANDAPPVSFEAPAGWSCRPRASTLPYLAGMVAPGKGRELMAGAFPLRGEPEKAVRWLARMGRPGEPVLEEVQVAGRRGWRCRQKLEDGDYLTVYVPAGEVVHFFTLEPAGDDGAALLERFLAGVRFPGI